MRVKWIFSVLSVAAAVAWSVLFREIHADDSLVIIEPAESDKIVSTETMVEENGGDDESKTVVRKEQTPFSAEETLDCIDPNTATEQSLMKISGIGPVLAGRIREYRESNGLFESVDHLMEIKGIGPKTVERIRKYICFR
jgi:competence ComEA-like helix-hairpin-helix protein